MGLREPSVRGAEGMMEHWAEATADRIVGDGLRPQGKLLFLGAADTGKTTLMYAGGQDLAIGAIQRWRPDTKATIRAPVLDIHRVQCLTIGDVRIDTSDWS